MTSALLPPEGFARAAEAAAQGPYVAGAATARPWLKLLLFLLATAAFLFLLFPVVDSIVRQVQAALDVPDKADASAWSPSQEWSFLAVSAIAGFAQLIVVLVPACIVYRKLPGAFLWPRQTGGLGLFLIAFAVTFAICGAFGPLTAQSFGWTGAPMFIASSPLTDRLLYAGAASLALAFPVIAEEVIFRGVLLRILGGLTRNIWLIVLINAVLFSAFHGDPDPIAFVSRMLTGAVWTWSALRLGGIAFAIGSHLGHNLLFALFLAPLSMSAAPALGWPSQVLLFQLVEVLVIFLVVEVLARRRDMRASNPASA